MARKSPAAREDPASEVAESGEDDAGIGPENFKGPSPNPKTNLILADIALRGGGMLVRGAIERGLLGKRYAPDKVQKIMKGRTMAEALAGTAIAKLATKSVPGAILVGGGLLAKTLYDRRKGKFAEQKGELAMDHMAAKGTREKD